MKTASQIYFAACIAAERELPTESRALIEHRDALDREWRNAGYPIPVPAALVAAGNAVSADPLANAAMEIRRMGNGAWAAEHTTSAAA